MFTQMYKEKFMRFPEGRAKALTFSYDDGVCADEKLIKLFNRYNLKATFNLNNPLYGAGKHGTLDEKKAYSLYNNCGHEIALHGDRHIFLNKVPLSEAALEIIENRKYLEDKYGRIIRGMAYAYSGYNDEVVRLLEMLGVTYARTTESSYGFDVPRDWLRLKPTCHHKDNQLFPLAERFVNGSPASEFKKREARLFYVWGHAYEFDDDGNWDIMEEFASRVANRSDIWYATNGEIREYVRAYDNLVFSQDGERAFNPSFMPVWIELRGKAYKIESGKEVKF